MKKKKPNKSPQTTPGRQKGVTSELSTNSTFPRPASLKSHSDNTGDTFIIPPGVPHIGRNVGTGPAKLVSSYFLTKGQPLASPAN